MVRFKAVFCISNEGHVIFHQFFHVTTQDPIMLGSLIHKQTPFKKDLLNEEFLSSLDLTETDRIIEWGERIKIIVFAVLDKNTRTEIEFQLRQQLTYIISRLERFFCKGFTNQILPEYVYTGVRWSVSSFIHDKMDQIYHQESDSLKDFLERPSMLVFELGSQWEKRYNFYRGDSKFIELTRDFPLDELDQLLRTMQENNTIVTLKGILKQFKNSGGEQVLDIFKFLTVKGIFDVYRFK